VGIEGEIALQRFDRLHQTSACTHRSTLQSRREDTAARSPQTRPTVHVCPRAQEATLLVPGSPPHALLNNNSSSSRSRPPPFTSTAAPIVPVQPTPRYSHPVPSTAATLPISR
jgi:hypothetical protein